MSYPVCDYLGRADEIQSYLFHEVPYSNGVGA